MVQEFVNCEDEHKRT
jgi:hypothetical protein